MNSFKFSKSADHIREWRDNHSRHPIDIALQKARTKAEKEIFKQKVQSYLIVGSALIAIYFLLLY